MKNALESIGNKADQMEERISELKDRKSRNDLSERRERTESLKK